MRLTIRAKLVAFTLMIIFLVGALLSWYTVYSGRQRVLASFERQAEQLTAILADSIVNDLYYMDTHSLRAKLSSAHVHPDLISSYVTDKEGFILAQGAGEESLREQKLESEIVDHARSAAAWQSRFDGNMLQIARPVNIADGTPIGFLFAAFSLEAAHQRIAAIVRGNLLMTAISLLIGTLLAVILATSFSRPISRLVKTSKAIGRGNFNTRLSLQRSDELGRLSESITQMAVDLGATTVSKAYVDDILESMNEMLIVVNPCGTIETVNRATAVQLGNQAHDLLGQPMTRFFPDAAAWLHKMSEKNRPSGQYASIETTCRTLHGHELAVSLSASPLGGGKNPKEQLVCLIQDITERKRAEREINTAREKAESANAAKSQFLANMSHEMRTPLNGVLALTELMLASDVNDKQRELAGNVHRSGKLLLDMISALLDLTRIETGKLHSESVSFDLRETIEDVLELFAENAHQKGLELNAAIPEELEAALYGNQVHIRQVLINLVSNGIKFTNQGEITVRCSVAERTQDQLLLHVAVQDTGIGIAPELREKVFQPFEQADTSTIRRHGGIGLGLAISKQLVEFMGGEIGFESGPVAGSIFYFSLRLELRSDAVQPRVPRPEALRELSVLIVDDNETSRNILKHQAIAWGMRTEAVSDGTQALEVLRRATAQGTPFDLALVDKHMPEIDGLELARRIKEDPTLAHIGVVIMVAGELNEGTHEGRRLGIQSCIAKPVRQSHLYKALLGAVNGRAESPPATPVGQAATKSTAIQPGSHVLLVEDNPVNTYAAELMLAHLGCEVTTKSNGKEAVEAVFKTPFDVVLMDCWMPEMDGFAATREIRRREREYGTARSLPIIALTAHAMKEDRERCLASGMDDYLSKPIDLTRLSTILQRWLAPTRDMAGIEQVGD